MSMNCQLDKQNKTKKNYMTLSEKKLIYQNGKNIIIIIIIYIIFAEMSYLFLFYFTYSLSLLTTNSSSSSSDPLMINDIKYSCTLISQTNE